MNDSSGYLKRIGTFIVLVFALSLPFYVISAITGEFALPLLLAPMVAALITRYIYQRNVKDLGWKLMKTDAQPRWWHWGNSRFLALSYAMPLAIGILVYGLTWIFVGGSFSTEAGASGIALAFVTAATGGVLLMSVLSIGEEVGWRGFLVPELAKRTGFLTAGIVSGLIWALWHYPLIFFLPGQFDFAGMPQLFAVPMFTLSLIAVSIFLAWIRLKTGSVWPAVIAHGSHNSLTLAFFNDMTSQEGAAPYIAGKVGVGLLIAWVIVALMCWRIFSRSNTVAARVLVA